MEVPRDVSPLRPVPSKEYAERHEAIDNVRVKEVLMSIVKALTNFSSFWGDSIE